MDAAHPAVTWNYGKFIQSIVDFVIIAFAIFMLIKAMNTVKKKEEAKPPEVAKITERGSAAHRDSGSV